MFIPKDLVYIAAADTAKFGLPPQEWAALLGFDEDGSHVTRVGEDIEYLSLLRESPTGTLAGLDIPIDRFPISRPGWPDEWHARVIEALQSTSDWLLERLQSDEVLSDSILSAWQDLNDQGGQPSLEFFGGILSAYATWLVTPEPEQGPSRS